jgi:excisionase family DNA binding protein
VSRNVIPIARNHAVYSVKDVAFLLSLNESTVYAWLRNGTLPGVKSGHRWGVPKKRLHQWIDNLQEDPDDNAAPTKESPTR